MRINIGCGNDYREGWTNIDRGTCKCDMSFDICSDAWPIEDNTVEEVEMQHIFEHIPKDKFMMVMRELYRVCDDGAIIHIISPYALSDNFCSDPTHCFPMTTRIFDYFDENKVLHENGIIYGWDDVKLRVNSKMIPNHPNGPDVEFNIIVVKD